MEILYRFAKKGYICLLLKTFYGLHQSSREWYKTIATLLLRLGFRVAQADYSVFIHEDNNVIIILYIDDILLFGKDK